MVAKRKSPKKTRKPAKQLSPDVSPPDPADNQVCLIPQYQAGIYVNEFNVLTLGAYWACIRVISETVAGLPFHVYKKRPDGGRDEQFDNPVDWLLHFQSNPETPAFQWRETLVAHALNWGNGYAEIERDMMGRPVWLWQITPDRVCPERDDSGALVYRVKNYGSPDTILQAQDVFHLRGLGFDGLVGYSVARMAARAIGAGIALEESVNAFFSNDSTPGGILKTPNKLDEAAQKNLRQSWMSRFSGPKNRRMIAVLEQGLEYQQMAVDPDSAQLVEQRQLTPAEICRWFRVPPHKIGDLAKATFSNIEQQAIEFVTDAIMPWCQRLEAEANVKLFGRTNRGVVFAKLNLLGLLRGDSAARSAFYQTMLDRGVFDINEVRGWEDLNPIGTDGDKRFVQANMALLEDAGQIPDPPPAVPPAADPTPMPADGTATPAENNQPDNPDGLYPIFEDAYLRIIGREVACVFDAARRLSADKFSEWSDQFLAKQIEFVRKSISPVFESMRSFWPNMVLAYNVEAFCNGYSHWCKDRCSRVYAGKFTLADYDGLGSLLAKQYYLGLKDRLTHGKH